MIKKSNNWYKLTEKGMIILKDLDLKWDKKYNEIIFNMY